jgi:hypothetical protein
VCVIIIAVLISYEVKHLHKFWFLWFTFSVFLRNKIYRFHHTLKLIWARMLAVHGLLPVFCLHFCQKKSVRIVAFWSLLLVFCSHHWWVRSVMVAAVSKLVPVLSLHHWQWLLSLTAPVQSFFIGTLELYLWSCGLNCCSACYSRFAL